jgi:hypothetical protein
LKNIKESGTKARDILVLLPSDEKILYQDLVGRRCSIFSKELMLAGLNLWKKSINA